MYLTDLTRNSFQSGVSATKVWLALCKLLIAKMSAAQLEGSGDVGRNLSNSVLVLYRSYPGDPGLQDYLKAAIQDGILPVSTFVATLLQAARSSDLHIPATLDTLCRIALDAHYSSGKPPIGSVVPENESTAVILATVHDALALLRTAYSLPISHFHQLTTSVSELVILLLSCVTDWSQVSNAQAMLYFTDVNDLLTNYRLTPDVRQVLDAFLLSLSLLIGDDVKAAREAQMMHTMHFALGKGDIFGPSSDTDVITLGLLLNYLVKHRAHEFGAGDLKNAVALLVAYFRWSSWTPTVYYTQLLCAAFICLSQNGQHSMLWKAFIVGRLPDLLVSFRDIVNADTSTNTDLGSALHAGLSYLLSRHHILVQGEQALARDSASDPSNEEDNNSRSTTRDFLQQIVKNNLLSQQLVLQLDPKVSNDSPPKWHAEVNDTGLDMAAFLESKLLQEGGGEGDVQVWMDRIWKDPSCHKTFANFVLNRFSVLSSSHDVDAFGPLCKILHNFECALDIVSLHESVADLIFYALAFLEDYDCETVGDPQTAVGHVGDVFLFLQYAIIRFKFPNRSITKGDKTFSPSYLLSPMPRNMPGERPPEEYRPVPAWFKALFDPNSEGIEDNILRSTKPKSLLRIAPFLFVQAIQVSLMGKLDKEALMNGISYFTGPLLNWSLVGIIQALVKELQMRQFAAPPVYYDILQLLILSPSCPRTVLALCSPQILSLVPERKRLSPNAPPSSFNISAIRQVLADAINVKSGSDSIMTNPPGPQVPYQQVQQAIQRAFSQARSQKSPFLDLKRCLETLPPIKFLQIFWTELVTAASLGELEACRRIATFVLTMPQEPTQPPILPIFLFIFLPSLIAAADRQNPPEQTMTMELLVSIISSVLNAAVHLEWAMRSAGASGNDRLVLGQSSAAMARRLAQDLRLNHESSVSGMISQRLASSQSFVANFPAFISELGTVT
ncbi:hypothetical protein CVT26_002089 [Gymnopilus dilepis]|uniref:Mediator of RNA polymerase II transcription subunit 5 n=1 Tax=Gymnopilus dilepis TaxID=231916 RepID=A0A409VBL9_9AGAR|nr:hypothetical protein CVT26_002089 [Gymnopilus dilepis]